MNFICHRVNTIDALSKIDPGYGVEIDLRDSQGGLILSHDPFSEGALFDDFLKCYRHGTLILNIKSERIEHKVLELIRHYGIKDYFFLDSTFPMIHLLSREGERKIALRFSEFEGMDTIRAMAGRVDWVWVDCFTRFPLTTNQYDEMKALGYKLCLVSPELQGRDSDIEAYKVEIEQLGIAFDAICTKSYNVDRWL